MRCQCPFRSVEVISLEWSYLKNTQSVFPALMISANYRDTHSASRIAVPATPIHHSSKVSIGSVRLDSLVEHVQADLKAESKIVKEDEIKGFVQHSHLSRPDPSDRHEACGAHRLCHCLSGHP